MAPTPARRSSAIADDVPGRAPGVGGAGERNGRVTAMVKLIEERPYRWRIEPEGAMRVPGIVFATRELLPDPSEDQALAQVAAVATLPGIVEAAYAMPDMHWGYGFPIGGVAATDV